MARFDLLKAVANLAKKVTKWNVNCDRLHILSCYVNSSLDLRLKGHIGGSSDKLALSLYSDSDFAGGRFNNICHRKIYGPHKPKRILSIKWCI